MEDQENIGGNGDNPVMPLVDVTHRNYDQSGQPTPIIQAQAETPAVKKPVDQTPAPTPETPDKKLYDQLYRTQLYTKSYPEFQKQFNNPQSIDKLYQGLSESELYTKPKDDFYNQFFSHLPSKEVSDAHDFINSYMGSPKANQAINKITGDQFYKNFYQQQATGAQGRDATKVAQPVPIRFPDQIENDRKDFANQIQNDPSLIRPVLSQAKRQNPSDAPKINQAMYIADASKREHSPAVMKYYGDQLASGKMDYDINNKQLVKPVGTFDALFQGLKNHSDTMDKYDYLTSHNDDDVIKYLDDQSKNYDPDKPVRKAVGALPSMSEMVGSNMSPMLKMGSGSIAGALAGATSSELALPIAAITTMGMGAGNQDFHHMAYANTLEETYRDLRQAHPDVDPHVILDEAKKQANFSGGLAIGQGLLMGEAGEKMAGKSDFVPVKPKAGFVKALTDIGKNSAKLIKDAIPDVSAQTAISGGVKAIENLYQGKPAMTGVVDNMAGTALFMAGLASLHAPDILLGKEARINLVDGYAKAPAEVVDNSLKKAVDLNVISPEMAVQTKQEIEARKTQTDGMPDLSSKITPEAEHLLTHIDETGANPSNMNKKMLEKLANDNDIKPEEGKDLTATDIVEQLRNKQRSQKMPKTFVDAGDLMEQAAPKLTGIYKNMYESDPEGFLKFIAEQAHGDEANRTELEQADGITKPLIDAAIAKYPEHILSPKTETNGQETEAHAETKGQIENQDAGQQTASSEKPHITVSTPNIVNVKTKENAIPEQSAGEMGVRNGTAVRQEVGGTNEPVQSAGESVQPEEIANENKNEGEGKRVGGIAQRVQEKINLSPYEKGVGWSKEDALKFGQTAIQFGIDPERVLSDKDYAIKEGMDDLESKLAVAQAHSIDLTKEMHDAGDKFGTSSDQFKAAQDKLVAYQKLVQPAKTASSKAFTAQQGEYDVDLNSFTSVGSKVKDITGKEPNAEQAKQIKELTQKNKELTQKLSDTDAKLIEATNKALGEKEGKQSIAQSGKAIADKIRKNAKLSRPGSFSAATPASLVWDGAVEVVAQAVEKGALLADAIVQGINHIKNTDWYKELSDDKKLDAMNEFSDWHHNQATDSIASKFIDKEGNKFTNDEAKEIWEYAKDNYLSKGTSFRDMIENVSNDTGLSFEQVSSAITTPKTKGLSDARWKQQYDLRKNQKATERYIDKQGESVAVRKFKGVVNAIREETVFGHGGVFVGTHAGMTLTDLPRAKHTIEAFLNANKFAYGKLANYEKAMENLKTQKNYVLAQRAGLQNNPDFINNDAEVISSKFGKLSESGKRGFNAIKVLRQVLFDSHYDALSDVEKQDPGAAVSIARLVNNATGATNLKLPDWFKEVTFAGGMEAARWGKLTRNPLEATSTAVKTLFNPKNVPIADRVFAKVWAKRVGAQLGTYAGLMAANAALQSYFNDGKNPVNWNDPTKSDWMKMKIGNTTFDFTSGMLSTMHFAEETLYHQPFGAQKSKDDVVTREGKTAFKYGLGKLSPAYADAGEVILQHDYSGNTLPWSNAKPLHNYNHKMTYPEYASSKLPLPVAEGFNSYFEAAHQKGADKTFLDNFLTGLKDGAISGTTGFRAYDTPEKKDTKTKSRPSLPTTYK